MPARLAFEYGLFFGLIAAYAAVGSPGSPIPFLLVGAVGAWWYLRRGDGRVDLWRWSAIRPALRPILGLWLAAFVLILIVLAIWDPGRLFSLPRQDPLLWAAVALFYPLLSVYPQELIFRAFLMRRYAPVFGTGYRAAAASAAAFGFAHIIYGSVASVAITAVGGWLFARRYQHTRSLAVVWLEHSLYGVLAFTVGLGDLFYHGAT